MYTLMVTLLGSKHAVVKKKVQCFSNLPDVLTSAHVGVYVNSRETLFIVYQTKHICEKCNHIEILDKWDGYLNKC